MDYKVVYTEDALRDFREILDHIASDSPGVESRFGTSLLNHVDLLQRFPRIGAPVPKRPGVRKLLHSPIRIYYRLQEDKHLVEVLHFWHCARKPPPHP